MHRVRSWVAAGIETREDGACLAVVQTLDDPINLTPVFEHLTPSICVLQDLLAGFKKSKVKTSCWCGVSSCSVRSLQKTSKLQAI